VAFNQYLIVAAEPLLFHTGMGGLFPVVSAGVSNVLWADTVRWVGLGSWCALRHQYEDVVLW
jgi:hypothetical protein